MTYLSRQNKAKKIIFVLFFLGLLSLATFKFVYAQTGGTGGTGGTATGPFDIVPSGVPTTICGERDNLLVCGGKWATTILRYLIFIAVAFSVIMIAYAGVEYILFGGGDGAKNAKNRIIYAIVGLVIAFIAFVAVRMIVNTLTS
ncbi:MAG: hypothetical protein KatS3mg097_379 [Candidatus Parcubacteria bacterium]|nr:MAG: hypothetical protein KatS3mg097_379 [Candidatus Parcubacteria bacterium]